MKYWFYEESRADSWSAPLKARTEVRSPLPLYNLLENLALPLSTIIWLDIEKKGSWKYEIIFFCYCCFYQCYLPVWAASKTVKPTQHTSFVRELSSALLSLPAGLCYCSSFCLQCLFWAKWNLPKVIATARSKQYLVGKILSESNSVGKLGPYSDLPYCLVGLPSPEFWSQGQVLKARQAYNSALRLRWLIHGATTLDHAQLCYIVVIRASPDRTALPMGQWRALWRQVQGAAPTLLHRSDCLCSGSLFTVTG